MSGFGGGGEEGRAGQGEPAVLGCKGAWQSPHRCFPSAPLRVNFGARVLEAKEFNHPSAGLRAGLFSMTTPTPKSYFRENVLRIADGVDDGEEEDGRRGKRSAHVLRWIRCFPSAPLRVNYGRGALEAKEFNHPSAGLRAGLLSMTRKGRLSDTPRLTGAIDPDKSGDEQSIIGQDDPSTSSGRADLGSAEPPRKRGGIDAPSL